MTQANRPWMGPVIARFLAKARFAAIPYHRFLALGRGFNQEMGRLFQRLRSRPIDSFSALIVIVTLPATYEKRSRLVGKLIPSLGCALCPSSPHLRKR